MHLTRVTSAQAVAAQVTAAALREEKRLHLWAHMRAFLRRWLRLQHLRPAALGAACGGRRGMRPVQAVAAQSRGGPGEEPAAP